MENRYHYNDLLDLKPGELLFWIVVDKTMDQLGIQDVVGVFAIVAGLPPDSHPRQIQWRDQGDIGGLLVIAPLSGLRPEIPGADANLGVDQEIAF